MLYRTPYRPAHRRNSLTQLITRRLTLVHFIACFTFGTWLGNTIIDPTPTNRTVSVQPASPHTTPPPDTLTPTEHTQWMRPGCTTPGTWNPQKTPHTAIIRGTTDDNITTVTFDQALNKSKQGQAWVLALCDL